MSKQKTAYAVRISYWSSDVCSSDLQASIHASAVVDPSARIGSGVEVGAFTFIGADVEIGDGTRVGPHCSIHGPTRIGRDNRIHGHAAIGGDPQDKKYGGERVALEIGDGNVIREFTTIKDRKRPRLNSSHTCAT